MGVYYNVPDSFSVSFPRENVVDAFLTPSVEGMLYSVLRGANERVHQYKLIDREG